MSDVDIEEYLAKRGWTLTKDSDTEYTRRKTGERDVKVNVTRHESKHRYGYALLETWQAVKDDWP